jgi:hypothetical protein
MDSFPLSDFRLAFSQFDAVTYPDSVVLANADTAKGLANFGKCKNSLRIWMLLTAHLLLLLVGDGQEDPGADIGVTQSASVGAVSVSYVAPKDTDPWSMSFLGTKYGALALAMLKQCRPAKTYVGGLPERAAITKVGGRR